jgi:GTP cyclohydrolase I
VPTYEAEKAVEILLRHIGEDPKREGLKRTPHRVAKALKEMTFGYEQSPKEILSTTFSDVCDEMVIVRDIRFWSLCEHHMLPFHGIATVGYLPKNKIVGLSKIGRLVHCFSRRLQVQERLTQEIANALMENLKPHGVGVIIKATHLCMEMRGVKTPAEMVTSCLLGQFREVGTRAEFLSMRTGARHKYEVF